MLFKSWSITIGLLDFYSSCFLMYTLSYGSLIHRHIFDKFTSLQLSDLKNM